MEKERGGARQGAGRKSKAEEQGLIEKLTPLQDSAFNALTEAINDKKDWAVKLYFQYMFGMPKQVVSQTNLNIDEKELTEAQIDKIKKEMLNAY